MCCPVPLATSSTRPPSAGLPLLLPLPVLPRYCCSTAKMASLFLRGDSGWVGGWVGGWAGGRVGGQVGRWKLRELPQGEQWTGSELHAPTAMAAFCAV